MTWSEGIDRGLFLDNAKIGRHVVMSSGTRIAGPLYMLNVAPGGDLYGFGAQRLVYSLDMLLPVVHLRHHHYEIELESPWSRGYLLPQSDGQRRRCRK